MAESKKLESMIKYGIGDTPLINLTNRGQEGNIYLKLEGYNKTGSIKARTAYYIVRDIFETHDINMDTTLVESSSGNLGLALGYFANELNINFLCLVDPITPQEKIIKLVENKVQYFIVSKGAFNHYREARIDLAKKLDKRKNWIWTNQYDNSSNFSAHYNTTGPEIWAQTAGKIDYLIASIGTGGTVCGISAYIKERNPLVKVVAVEPTGSTIFGGTPKNYINAGAGMHHPSGIVKKYGKWIDFYCHIPDEQAIYECNRLRSSMDISVGISSGAVLSVAAYLSSNYPQCNIVAISSDGGESYLSYLNSEEENYSSQRIIPNIKSVFIKNY